MALEQIKLIKEAENQGELIRKKSISQAKDMVVHAEREAAQLLEEAHSVGEESYKKVLDEAGIGAEHSYRDIISKAQEEIHHKMLAAESNVEEAVSIIVRKVVS